MRILHSKKLILISKPRSGSTSLRFALDDYLRENDIKCDEPHDEWHPHHTAAILKNIFIGKGWPFDSYWKVCTSRNPYDLVVSYYFYFKPDSAGKYNYQPGYDATSRMPFKKWVHDGRIWDQTRLQLADDISSIGISTFCFDQSGRCLVDEIFDISEHQSDVERSLGRRLDDQNFALPHVNASDCRSVDYRQYFDEESKNRVESLFPKEFELFNYEF